MDYDLLNSARFGNVVSPLFQLDSPHSFSPLLSHKSANNEATFDDIFDQLAASGDVAKSPLHFFTPPDILQNVENLMSAEPLAYESTDATILPIPTIVPKQERGVPQLTMDLTGRKIKQENLPKSMVVPAPPKPVTIKYEEEEEEDDEDDDDYVVPPPAPRPVQQKRFLNPRKRKKKSPPARRQKVLTQKSYEDNPGPVEAWKTVQVDDDFEEYLEDALVSVKTRCEAPLYHVPPTLYSSLKYEMKCEVVFSEDSYDADVLKDVSFLLGKVKVVHSENYREILRGKGGGHVLKGTIESALTRVDEDSSEEDDGKVRFKGIMKVQFNNVSYHHKKHDLRWEVWFHEPNQMEVPVLIVRSGAFKVFARKPSTKKKSTKKRGRKRKRDFNCFQEKLNELVRCAKKLKVGEKKKAMKMISNRLVDLDPDFFGFLED